MHDTPGVRWRTGIRGHSVRLYRPDSHVNWTNSRMRETASLAWKTCLRDTRRALPVSQSTWLRLSALPNSLKKDLMRWSGATTLIRRRIRVSLFDAVRPEAAAPSSTSRQSRSGPSVASKPTEEQRHSSAASVASPRRPADMNCPPERQPLPPNSANPVDANSENMAVPGIEFLTITCRSFIKFVHRNCISLNFDRSSKFRLIQPGRTDFKWFLE